MESSKRSLEDWLQHCASLSTTDIDLGLERLERVLEGNPWATFSIPVVTFAGTNGKGSTIAATNALLSRQGVRVGVYTSPHLIRYNERITLCNQEVSDDLLCEAFSAVEHARGSVPLTYFEFGTLAALYIFQTVSLDVVLLEVGLGGRLDAVNIVDADIAVITQLGLDHTEWLGNTLAEIAKEKAGIMRPLCPVIVAAVDPPSELKAHADEVGAVWLGQEHFGYRPCTDAKTQDSCDMSTIAWDSESWRWFGLGDDGKPLTIEPLPAPKLPLASVATGLQVLQLLKPLLSSSIASLTQYEAICEVIRHTGLFGRMTYLPKTPELAPVLLDIAHNQQSVNYLAKRIRLWQQGKNDVLLGYYSSGRVIAFFGALDDKPVTDMVIEMRDLIDEWVPASTIGPRAMSAEAIKTLLSKMGVQVAANSVLPSGGDIFPEQANTLLATLRRKEGVALIVVFGSFYLVGPLLQSFPMLSSSR